MKPKSRTQLAKHAERMNELIAKGMDRESASAQAMKELTAAAERKQVKKALRERKAQVRKQAEEEAAKKPVTLQQVQHMARYGHRDWLYWADKDGWMHSSPRSAESIKHMLLQTGTKGWWCLVMANDGTPMLGFWAMGLNILNQSKRGWR